MRAARQAIEESSPDRAKAVHHAVQVIEQSRSKGILKSATASRYVSRLMKAEHSAR